MSLLRPLDPAFPIQRQIELDASPVVLVNIFTLDKADEPTFLKVWQDDADFMKRQPGFISTQLHRGIAGSGIFLNYAVWESAAHFRSAFANPEFRARLGGRGKNSFRVRIGLDMAAGIASLSAGRRSYSC